MHLGCGKNEFNMLGRLFKSFKKRIEGLNGKHMNLIYDVNTVFRL